MKTKKNLRVHEKKNKKSKKHWMWFKKNQDEFFDIKTNKVMAK